MKHGEQKKDRTGTGTISCFAVPSCEYDISETFPLITTKRIHTKSVVGELLWFLSGDTNISYLKENGINIWNEWADKNGDLGFVYGASWRKAPKINYTREGNTVTGRVDQVQNLIDGLKNDPDGRRHILAAWNPSTNHMAALPPCHAFVQFYVTGSGHLECHLYQRSADLFLGVPFNIASYSLLTYIIAAECGLKPGRFIHSFGDAHIYVNHMEQVEAQLSRSAYESCTLQFSKKPWNQYEISDFTFADYRYHPSIKAPIAV